MIITSLPDIDSFSEAEPELHRNAVMSAYSQMKYSYPEHHTPYLFIANEISKGNYTVGGKQMTVSQSQFLLLNANERISIHFSDKSPLHTTFVLFEKRFISSCINSFLTPEKKLLDDPTENLANKTEFPKVPHNCNHDIKKTIYGFKKLQLKQDELDAVLAELLVKILEENEVTAKRLHAIEAKKASTKEELYRRLTISIEWMNDNIEEKLSLDEIASIACLNKFHFLSGFKAAYNTTPIQYYRELKLQRAYTLLKNQTPVAEVCYRLGFESIGSFSNLFKKRYGFSPSVLSR